MDASSFDYVLRLAAIAIAFVGFATIVVTLRKGLGGGLSAFHILLVRIFTETGLAVAVGSLLPPLLNLFRIPSSTIWRASSGIAAAVAMGLLIAYIKRRNRIGPRPRVREYVPPVISALAVAALVMNAAGALSQPNPAPYAAALTWFLFSAGLIFLQTFDEILHGKEQ